jgi:hypothetical protein
LRIAALLISLVINASVAAQTAEPVPVRPSLALGDVHRYELTSERHDTDPPIRKGGSRAVVTIEVIDRLDTGWVLRWTIGQTQLDAPGADNPFVERFQRMTEGWAIELVTDADGLPVNVRNLSEIVQESTRVKDELLAFATKGLPEDQAAKLRQNLDAMYTPEAIVRNALEKPQLLFMFTGRALSPGQSEEYETSLPSPLGGDALPARGTWTLRAADEKTRVATVEWAQVVDPDKARSSFLEAFRKMGMPQDAELPSVEIKDLGTFHISLQSGWPVKVAHERVSKVGPKGRVDRTTFNRLDTQPSSQPRHP